MINKFGVLVLALSLVGCAAPARHGMVKDPATGMQYGSVIEKNIFVDPSQFADKRVRVTTRNVSGDRLYRLSEFEAELQTALNRRGYRPVEADPFGVRFDVNVLYSGQVQENMAQQFAFLGGAAGGIAGYRADTRAGTVAGGLAGAALGALIGSSVTDDTYIVIAEVSIGVNEAPANNEKTTITFSSSAPLQRNTATGVTPFREVLRTKVAVLAGGRNVSQAEVAAEIRRRLVDIVTNVL